MATLKILQTTGQILFFLVSLKCSSVSCITGYTNIYANKNYYIQSSLDSKKVILQIMLLPISLIKSTSPLKMIITHSKIFDTVNHLTLLKKLERTSYLNGSKQYIKFTECANTLKKVFIADCHKAQY